VVVNGTLYANGTRPWFVGVAAPGSTVDLVLSGSGVIGSKVVGTVAADAAGNFRFQLPAGVKNGSFVLVARAHEPGVATVPVSVPLSFKVGPIPRIKPVRKPPVKRPKPHKTAPHARKPAVVVRHNTSVHTLASAKANVVDHALHALSQAPLPLKKRK
jgi:hypothetical protein